MEILKRIFWVSCVFAIWSYTITIVTEYLINRPTDSFIELVIGIGILAYSLATFYWIYRILTKTIKND